MTGEEHDDLYSVSPAAMSDEQIARRDAMSIVELADSAAASSVTLNVLLEQVCRQVERLQRERDELKQVLEELWANRFATVDAFFCRIEKSTIERAEKLLAGG